MTGTKPSFARLEAYTSWNREGLSEKEFKYTNTELSMKVNFQTEKRNHN